MHRNYRGNIANEIYMLGCVTFVMRYGAVVGESVQTFCWSKFQDIAYWSTKE